jgi:beta-N-acetylhexosaminidase
LKHFPGLGAANLDTHKELPSVQKSFAKLWKEDIAPFRMLRREAPMVLISHAAYPSVTHDPTPASLSKKWITEILRKKIQYRGLVISDDLEMGGVLKAATVDQAAVEHVRAGGDIALVCHAQEHVLSSFESLLTETERDARFARRCRDSIARVLAFKKKWRTPKRRTGPKAAAVQKLSCELWEFSEQVRMAALEAQSVTRQKRA